jgi:PhnB protein
MTMKLNPYLTFNGNARQAMELYQRVLGGELVISTFGEYGAAEGVDPEGVMHANLVTDAGFTIMASDNAPGAPEVTGGGSSSVSISGQSDDADVMRGWFEGLSEGGTVTMPLEKQMWGDEFGMVVDRFGTPWMVNIGAE